MWRQLSAGVKSDGGEGGGTVGVPYGAVSTDWQTGPAELSADTVLD